MKHILKPIAILFVKYLQKRYKSISLNSQGRHTNQVLNKLILIQSILYYFKEQFSAWGYFHPHCIWTKKDETFFRKLFPEKDFKEIDIVTWYNPEAIIYYHNKIFTLSKKCPPNYEIEIEKQLKIWKNWN